MSLAIMLVIFAVILIVEVIKGRATIKAAVASGLIVTVVAGFFPTFAVLYIYFWVACYAISIVSTAFSGRIATVA